MYIDVVFSPNELSSRGDIKDKSVIVIDVLRATSTMIYAFWGYRENGTENLKGCKKIIPVESIEEAKEMAKKFNRDEILLAGERFCLKPQDFDLGNSPEEYTMDKVRNKTIIFTTTNGTRALKLSENAKFITTGSFVNATACVNRTFDEGNDVLILCAGRSNKTAKEDSACAGLLAKFLINRCREYNLDYDISDSADIAIKYLDYYRHDILALLESSEAGRNLREVMLEKDLVDCSLLDVFSVATRYRDGFITVEA